MANYHLCVHPNVSRGKGQSLVRTAAYNARARLTDERTGKVWDYRHLGAVLFEGIYAAKAPNWARDLGQLVNGVERSEKRCDAQLALNIDIALPHEQTLEQSRRLLQDFVREQFMRAGYAAHAAIHPPEPGGDPRNIHAHVLVTLRQIGPDGFAPTKAEQQERYRNRSAFVEQLREKWEQLANRHLARNGIDARIDRRSLKEQGIDGKPPQHRGPAVTAIQRRSQVEALGPASCDQQAAHAAQEPLPAEPERIAVLPPPAAAQMEISIGGGENSHAIEDLPIGMSIAIEDDPHVDRNTAGPKRGIPTYPPLAENVPAAITTRPIIAAEAESPETKAFAVEQTEAPYQPAVTAPTLPEVASSTMPGDLPGAIKRLFRAAVKAVLRRVEPAPQPKQRRRKGETEGEFRRLARRCSRRTDMRQEFRQRASITSRFLTIPADVFAMATAHLADTLISLADEFDSGYDDVSVAVRENISPQP